jgi:hypothetical protein
MQTVIPPVPHRNSSPKNLGASRRLFVAYGSFTALLSYLQHTVCSFRDAEKLASCGGRTDWLTDWQTDLLAYVAGRLNGLLKRDRCYGYPEDTLTVSDVGTLKILLRSVMWLSWRYCYGQWCGYPEDTLTVSAVVTLKILLLSVLWVPWRYCYGQGFQ